LHVSLAVYTARTNQKNTNIRLEKREQENILIYMELSRYKPWNKTGLLTDRTLYLEKFQMWWTYHYYDGARFMLTIWQKNLGFKK
jgi:hypothetical protein